MSQDYFSFFGFNSNPFENNTAEREPNIELYAVRPPYLDRVLKTSTEKGIFVLSGSRGSGKSATRITVAKSLWNLPGGPLVVPLVGFNVFRVYSKNLIPLELYADQICFLVIEQLLGWLSSLDDEDATKRLNSLSKDQRQLTDRLVSNFYLNRSDNARATSVRTCFETLDISLVRKGGMWIDKRWDHLASVVSQLANKVAQKYGDFDIGDPSSYEALLKRRRQEGFDDPIYVFSKAVELARAFGFSGVVLHIDKVDETDWTNSSVSAAGDLIYPLLANIQLHEIDGLTWTFFLWDKVRDYLCLENKRPVRWDKIPNGKISWNEGYLRELINKRIRYFSNDKVQRLDDICDSTVNVDETCKELFELSEKSPRNLITLLDQVVSEHIQLHQESRKKLNPESFCLGLDAYSVNSVSNLGVTNSVDQLTKLKAKHFVTKDVASRFRISNQAARGRIDQWIENGLIEYSGSQVGPSGGRPVDQFEVADPRLRRVIDRDLWV